MSKRLKYITSICVFFIFFIFIQPAYSALINQWDFDEGTGDTAYDPVGSVDGDLKSGATWSSDNKQGGSAIEFSGTAEGYIDLGNNLGFDVDTAFSISGWMKREVTGSGYQTIISKTDSNLVGWRLELQNDAFVFYLQLDLSCSNIDAIMVTTVYQYPINNSWFHFAVTYDGLGSASGVKIYINCKEAPVSTIFDTLSGSILNSDNATIGARTGGTSPFYGIMDELEIDGTALPSNDINSICEQDNNTVKETGLVIWFGGNTSPAGYLLCDGRAVSRDDYADLFNVIGTTYGPGDESTTFDLPDLRGEFIRGWDGEDEGARDVDTDRIFGSWQNHAFQNHTHTFTYIESGVDDSPDTSWKFDSFDAASEGTKWRNTTAVGGNETRPRNIALLPCIKY